MSVTTQHFKEAYARAFARYLDEADENALHIAYELGREAVERHLSVLELARVHHEALRAALRSSSTGQHELVALAAADFLAESLSAFEMVRRGYGEARERADAERRHAAVVRRLSTLLADTSLALDGGSSLKETLQLVAEAARELTRAGCCIAVVEAFGRGRALTAVSGDAGDGEETLVAPLTALSGKRVGSLRLVSKEDGHFTEMDNAILEQLAQMAAAAIERTRLYR